MSIPLSVEGLHRPCAFVLQINDTGETLKKLSLFFQDRHVFIDNLHMHCNRDGSGTVIIHCQIERDRIGRTVQLLEQLPGVLGLQKLEGR